MFRLYWAIIGPSKEQIQWIKIYSAFWNPKRLSETCCHKNNLRNKLLCLTEIYTLYGSEYV